MHVRIKRGNIELIAVIVLSIAFSSLFALLSFNAKILQQVDMLQERSPILISREMILPQNNGGILYMPQSWSQNSIHKISEATLGLGVVSQLSLENSVVRTSAGKYQRVVVLGIGKDILSILAPGQPCNSDMIFKVIQTSDLDLTEIAWLGKRRVQMRTTQKTLLLDALVPNNYSALVVKCNHIYDSSSKFIFLPNVGAEKVAQAELKLQFLDSEDVDNNETIQSRITIEPLSDVVLMEIESHYAWLKILTVGFIMLVLTISLSIALFDAIKIRGDYSVMRALGATKLKLLLHSQRRILKLIITPLLIGALGFLVVTMSLHGQSHQIRYQYLLWLIPWTVGLIEVCVLFHFIYAVTGIDARVVNSTSIAGGKFKSISIGVSIILLVVATALFSLFALSMTKYSLSLSRMSFGYNPVGLYVTELTPKIIADETMQKASLSNLSGVIMQLSTQNESVALACNSPWDLDSLNMDAHYSGVATFMDAGSGIAGILQIPVLGRDLQVTDIVSGRAQLIQSVDNNFANDAKIFGKSVGVVEGVVTGALVPKQRNIIFRMMRNDQCEFPLLLQRPNAKEQKIITAMLISSRNRIMSAANDYVYSEPKEVISIIKAYREPLERIRLVANGGLLVAFISVFLLVLNACISFIDLYLRTFAIKNALGQTSIHSAFFVTMNILKYALLGVIVSIVVWPYLELAVIKLFDFIPRLQLLDIILVSVSIMVVIGILSFSISMFRFRKLDLVTALRIE